MDGDQFDRWTRIVAKGVSRRGVFRGAVAGVSSAVFAVVGRNPATAAPNACAQACAFEPKGPRQAACKQACKQCGGNVNLVCFGPQIICCPAGDCCFNEETGAMACASQLPACGDGLTRVGCACVAVTVCPSGEFAESCADGINTNCGPNGVCALVRSADSGDCDCVERICTGVVCGTDADCVDGNVCVTIPGCCPETTFCGVPCGSAGGAARTGGWG